MKRKLIFKPSKDVPEWFMREFLPWFERITIGYLNETIPDPNWDESDSPPSCAAVDARYYDKTQVYTKTETDAEIADAIAGIVFPPFPYLNVVDQKAANTGGGTFTSGAWRTRDLQTVRTNTITGASLSSNQIILPIGTYQINSIAPAFACARHKSKLYNVSDATDILVGSSVFSSATSGASINSVINGQFAISAQKTFEIRHQCQTTRATDGFGIESNLGVVEIYTQVQIWKVA